MNFPNGLQRKKNMQATFIIFILYHSKELRNAPEKCKKKKKQSIESLPNKTKPHFHEQLDPFLVWVFR